MTRVDCWVLMKDWAEMINYGVTLDWLFCSVSFANRHKRRGGGGRRGPTGRLPSGSDFYCSRRHIGTYMQASCVFQSWDNSFKGSKLVPFFCYLCSVGLHFVASIFISKAKWKETKRKTNLIQPPKNGSIWSMTLVIVDGNCGSWLKKTHNKKL